MGIAAVDLIKTYRRRRVVDGARIELEPGEVVGLLGPNGAGKTTTFYMIVGLETPDSGRIEIDGRDVTTLPIHRRARLGVGYLAQEPSIFRKMSVEDNIRAVLQIAGVDARARQGRLDALISEFGLADIRKQMGFTLSGGERRRVEIARALAASPRYMLLDEPFTGVDPIAVGEIQAIAHRLRQAGLGVLITDHNVRDTLAIVDRAYIMHRGTILVSGSAREVSESPAARRFYLGERFTL
ncbi:MAG: LPS export ABC transporter ATP-binding protein [Firmicutes bacterium]|jgi:lipopolysaccharide export system ATP-binding protein|nr:LPS export ABC transporter ATP-binding protein [Bacillota bacterium]